MGISCLFSHKWDGCTCIRCGKVRKQQHAWAIDETRTCCQCKRCGTIAKEEDITGLLRILEEPAGTDEKRDAANILIALYKMDKQSETGKNVALRNGVLLAPGKPAQDVHVDIPHTDEHTDREEARNGWFCDHCDANNQTPHSDNHTDTQEVLPSYFCIE